MPKARSAAAPGAAIRTLVTTSPCGKEIGPRPIPRPSTCSSTSTTGSAELMTPTPRIQRYVDELLSRWPDINTDEGQDSPWADGPLIGNASGPDDLLRDGHEQSCRCSRRNRRTGHRGRTGVLRPPKLPPCSDRSGRRAPSWPNCCSRQRTGDITAPGALLFPESRAVI